MKKILTIVATLLFAAYLLFSLFVSRSGNEKGESELCNGIVVEVRNKSGYDLIHNSAINDILDAKGLNPSGMMMGEVDIEAMENALKTNPLIHTADCYKTNDNEIFVNLVTKVPILRVINNKGENFYVDSNSDIIDAVLQPMDIPLATGYIDRLYASEKLYELALLLQESEFWNAQIAQINVTEENQVELVPRVGSHILLLGDASNFEQKLDRLMNFYIDGLGVVGWNKYSSISVAFSNQVVCKKK